MTWVQLGGRSTWKPTNCALQITTSLSRLIRIGQQIYIVSKWMNNNQSIIVAGGLLWLWFRRSARFDRFVYDERQWVPQGCFWSGGFIMISFICSSLNLDCYHFFHLPITHSIQFNWFLSFAYHWVWFMCCKTDSVAMHKPKEDIKEGLQQFRDCVFDFMQGNPPIFGSIFSRTAWFC